MAAQTKTTFRIAIVGGGIGGLVSALAINHFCKEYNISIDVYEQAREYKEIGAGVGLGINAAKLLHYIGLGDRLNKIGSGLRGRGGIWISFCRYDNSETVHNVPLVEGETIKQASVHRAELLDLLVHAITERSAATLHVNKKCSGISVSNQKNLVSL